MKKFILCLMLFVMGANISFGADVMVNFSDTIKYHKKIMEIGFRILNSNEIEHRMTFYYDPGKTVNAYANGSNKQIVLYRGLRPYFDDDNEVAAILSHEIAHGMDFYQGYWRRVSMAIHSKAYERKADKKAIDYMVNAGYNPVAMIIILNKICEEPSWFEVNYTHPIGSERLSYVYEYIYAKYPAYLVDNDYKNNLYYQNFLLTTKKEREIIRKKYSYKVTKPEKKTNSVL